MPMLGFLRQKRVAPQDTAAIHTRLRKEARRIATEQALSRERSHFQDGIQIIESQSRRLTAMANAMALTRESVSD